MASPLLAARLLVLCLLCGGACAAAKRRYLSVSMDELLGGSSKKAHVDCPPWNKSAPSPHRPRGIPISYPPTIPPAEAPAVTIPDSTGTSLGTLEFVVTVGFGTPAQTYTLMFDTGSDVSWIQCLPCSGHCYKQHDPIFDPTKSATYSAVPCGHPQCAAAGGKCSSNGTCLYKVQYGDGSSTAGVLSHETLSLTSARALPGFAFGCGETNLGDFGDVDGLIGLGRGQLSLSSQAAASFGAAFSYCLPSYNTSHGYLTIGTTTPASGSDGVRYTAMIQKQDYPSFYFVDLVSIVVGGFVLPVPPILFTRDGTLLDSGTVLTYLPPEAYTALRDRFKFTMTQYKPAPAYDPFDTCYDFAGQNAIFMPLVSFKFSDGSSFDLSPFGVLIFPDDTAPATGCLAFVPRPSTMPFTIVGNTQQRNTEMIYDVAAEKIGFVSGSC
ncbi:aspartyl protease family protein At5g10770 [Zea mays]|uniref:aspartyl protease family protein At5g10770 n=1 Tax=Zea mays TaxID=4577 RepID=UPI0004DEC652|nr:aspartyl protease family protein At5g10770 [Zea mays]|eukprot:XP_008660816.1 aspartyl protease family protein At5g10770 [Zea mays]